MSNDPPLLSDDEQQHQTEAEEEAMVDETDSSSPAADTGMPWGARLKMAEMEFGKRGSKRKRKRDFDDEDDSDDEVEDEGASHSGAILGWIGEPSEWGPYPDLQMRAVALIEKSDPGLAMEGLSGIVLNEEADEALRLEARERLEEMCHQDGLEDLEGEIHYADALSWRAPKPPVIQSNQGKVSAILVAALVHAVAIAALILYTLTETPDEVTAIIGIASANEEASDKWEPEFSASKSRPVPSSGMSHKFVQSHAVTPFALPSATVSRSDLPGIGDSNMSGFGNDYGMGGGLHLRGSGTVPKLNGIRARNLAVVLDVSGSMASYLPSLSKEIARRFPTAEIILSPNSMMYLNDRDSPVGIFFFEDSDDLYGLSRFKDRIVQKGDVGTGILHVLRKTKCDAIYVLTDFQDGESDPDPFDEIVKLARSKKVKLHFGIPHGLSSIFNYSQRKKRLKVLFDYAKVSGSIRTKLD